MATEISPAFFYLFAALAVVFALMVVFLRNPASSAFSLIMVFFATAGVYALLDAHLIATMQILVYAGAIMVLFIFVIMLLNADSPSFDFGRAHLSLRIASCVVGIGMAAAVIWAIGQTPATTPVGGVSVAAIEQSGGNTKILSRVMFSEYVLPFELTSLLILAGIVGSVAIAKRKLEPGKKGQS